MNIEAIEVMVRRVVRWCARREEKGGRGVVCCVRGSKLSPKIKLADLECERPEQHPCRGARMTRRASLGRLNEQGRDITRPGHRGGPPDDDMGGC